MSASPQPVSQKARPACSAEPDSGALPYGNNQEMSGAVARAATPGQEARMSSAQQPAAIHPKPKKSVALSGVTAGNTALCTVGRTGNDLHYRGYDIIDIASGCEFEEIAYLLVHEKLPNRAELARYKTKLKSLRLLPRAVSAVL